MEGVQHHMSPTLRPGEVGAGGAAGGRHRGTPSAHALGARFAKFKVRWCGLRSECWPRSTKLGPLRPKRGRVQPKSGWLRPDLGCVPASTEIQLCVRPTLGGIRQRSGRAHPNPNWRRRVLGLVDFES